MAQDSNEDFNKSTGMNASKRIIENYFMDFTKDEEKLIGLHRSDPESGQINLVFAPIRLPSPKNKYLN